MEEVEIPPTSVFVGHGHMHHSTSEWRGGHSIRYQSYLAPENNDPQYAVAFDYGKSIALEEKKTAVSFQGDLDWQEEDLDGDAVMGDGFGRGRTVRKTSRNSLHS